MIADLKPYPAMKDSGVEWLGEVPEHWNVAPNRAFFDEIKDRDCPDEEMLSVTIKRGVIKQASLLENTSKKDSSNLDRSNYKLVQPGDIAYNKMRAWQGAVGVSSYRGIISPAYIVQRPRDGGEPGYFHQLFRIPSFAKEAERWSYGITSDMWSLRPEHFKLIYSCLPPLPEQAAIVQYLDHVERRVRRLVRTKRKLIALLTEQKQAITHRAVTRGLDPNVPLKNSGVEWLDKVPEHWNEVRLKFLVKKITDGEHISPSLVDQGVRLLSAKDIRDRTILYDVNKYVTPDQADQFWRRCRPEIGDLLVVSRGATIGRVGLVEQDVPFCLMGSVILCKTMEEFTSEFLYYALNAHHAQTSLWFTSASSAQQAIYIIDVAELRLPIPPRSEREAIVQHLDRDLRSISDATARTTREIDLLNEYRTRLIADVVTGKLDVREAAAALPEVDPLAAENESDTLDTDSEMELDDLDAIPEEAEA